MKWLIIVNLIALSQATLSGKTNIFRKVDSTLESAESEPIAPYSFSYSAEAIDGQSAREEVSDGTGVVRGSYVISSADGIKRTVNYIADENGFRAQVQTNEPGTESKSPANVDFESSQPPAEEIALKYGPKPNEQLSQVQSFGNILPKPIGFGQVINQQTFTPILKQKAFVNVPLPKKIETGFNPMLLSKSSIPQLRTQFNPINTPIRLLTKLPASNIAPAFKPLEFEAQQGEELVQVREQY